MAVVGPKLGKSCVTEFQITSNQTEYIERRKEVMCWWSVHIGGAAKGILSLSNK